MYICICKRGTFNMKRNSSWEFIALCHISYICINTIWAAMELISFLCSRFFALFNSNKNSLFRPVKFINQNLSDPNSRRFLFLLCSKISNIHKVRCTFMDENYRTFKHQQYMQLKNIYFWRRNFNCFFSLLLTQVEFFKVCG